MLNKSEQHEEQKISYYWGLILTLLILLTGIYVYVLMEQQAKVFLSTSLEALLKNKEHVFSHNINQEQGIDGKDGIALRHPIIQALEKNIKAPNLKSKRILQNITKSLLKKNYLAVSIYNAHGDQLAHTGQFSRNPKIRIPLNSLTPSFLLWGNEQFSLIVNNDIYSHGQYLGKVVLEKSMPQLTHAFTNVESIGKTGEIAICKVLEKDTKNMQCLVNGFAGKKFFQRQPRIVKGKPLPMSHALDGETGLIFSQDYRKENVVAAYSQIDPIGLGVLIKIDQDELYSPITSKLKFIIPALITLVFFGILLFRWLVAPLVRKLIQSEQQAQAANIELEKHKTRYRLVLDNSPYCIHEIDSEGRLTSMNPTGLKMLEFQSENDIKSVPYIDGIADEDKIRVSNLMKAGLQGKQSDFEFKGINGKFYQSSFVPIEDKESGALRLMGWSQDISKRKKVEEQLNYLAYYDYLTGLPNRRLFTDRLQQAMKESLRNETLVAVLFLDLDHFKKINDSMGHEEGDILLKKVAQRLTNCMRVSDTLARLGGDEFTLVLSSLSHANDAVAAAENILLCFSSPFYVNNVELYVSVSIGITLYPLDDNSANDLLRNADTAMYHAKDNGRNNFQFYSSEMTEQVEKRLKLEGELRDASLQNEFVLFYQPKIDTKNNTIVGVEALLRWQHPKRGLVAPDDFISTAEDMGLIISIGEWVLQEACKQTQILNTSGINPIHVSVNLSARQLDDPNLARMIIEILNETRLDPALLDLEITESMLMSDMSKVAQTLKELSALGITISIDDFGTGYSSLAYLKQFPISTLKIDRSFIRDTPENKDDESIIIAIIHMSNALGLKTLAEGVETKEQLDFLKQHECDLIQGYYFSKPVAFNEIIKLFQEKLDKNKMVQIDPAA